MRGDGYVYKRGERWWIAYYAPKDGRSAFRREAARIVERKGEAPRPARNETEARRALKRRRDEIGAHRVGARAFAGPAQERLTLKDLLDGLLTHLRLQGRAYASKLEYQLKPVRKFFDGGYAADVTTSALEQYQQAQLAAGWKPATVNRSLEGLRRAYRYAAGQTPPLFPRHLVPSVPLLPMDNVRTGYFDRADIEALLAQVHDVDVRDFIEWGFRTGMRKGEIGLLTWDMVDMRTTPWVLRIPGAITKNRDGRPLALVGGVRTIIERRLAARRLDVPLVFHRTAKGKPGQPISDITGIWKAALAAAKLPSGRLFHDLRRSAVRNLIDAGVDPQKAMAVSGHKTDAMLRRYRIIDEAKTAEALLQVDAYLAAQPAGRNVVSIEHAQNAHNEAPAPKRAVK